MMSEVNWPPQQLPFSKKNKIWRKKHLDWADNKSFHNYSLVRKSVMHKKINYDLIAGKLYMDDLQLILNPDNIQANYIPDKIQHYPIINSKLHVLRGEESSRVFDFKVVVTNPTAISEIEKDKKDWLSQVLYQGVMQAQSDEEAQAEMEKIADYATYEWQDYREIRANSLLNHYMKELNVSTKFNSGFMDAMIVGEEIYKCDIIGGEPTLERLNPLKVRVFKSGLSNRVEDADMIIIEDYWSPGRIIDTYYDVLTKKDMKYLEDVPNYIGQASHDAMGNIDERLGFVNNYMIGEEITSQEGFFWNPFGDNSALANSLLPYDISGNIRVLQVYWKSRRKIKKVKSYDIETGEEVFTFYPETYVLKEELGEEEDIFWINEAWEGTKIGTDIYINMRPRVVQYNRLSNPSICHFGIIGTIYNINDDKPLSMVDMMKPYAYMYDIVYDKMTKLLSHNWGKLVELDFAKVPKNWDIEKWLYFAKTNNIIVKDSFKEGEVGAATGKLAAALNSASSGVVDASFGNEIQFHLELLSFLKSEAGEVVGISPQREGQISNRETVGGVERATLQSSHITEWVFIQHENLKKRVLECLLETAKIALKGRKKKFQYILSDSSVHIMDIDGDEFAECDYGLIVDNDPKIQELDQKLDMLTQAAVQNQYQLSTIMRLYTSMSIAEKTRMLENYERKMQEQQQQQAEADRQMQMQQMQMQAQSQEEEREFKDKINQRDNETKVLVAEINGQAEAERFAIMNAGRDLERDGIQEMNEIQRDQFKESIRQFDKKMQLEKDKLEMQKQKIKKDQELKQKQINKK